MGQATIKATKRQLRRAIGPSALETIQAQEQTLAILSNAVASCQRDVAELAIDHARVKRGEFDVTRDCYVTLWTLQCDIVALQRHVAKCVNDLSGAVNSVLQHADKQSSERTEPLRRPFLGRLRWLFLGK